MSQALQIQAQKLLDWIKDRSMVDHAELSTMSQSLIHTLRVMGHFTEEQAKHAFIEPQGAWEFDTLHICCADAVGGFDWFQVTREGQFHRC